MIAATASPRSRSHDRALKALNAARDEVPTRHGWRSSSTPRRSWTSRGNELGGAVGGGSQTTLCMQQPISIRGSLRSGPAVPTVATSRPKTSSRRWAGRCTDPAARVSAICLSTPGQTSSVAAGRCICASSWRSPTAWLITADRCSKTCPLRTSSSRTLGRRAGCPAHACHSGEDRDRDASRVSAKDFQGIHTATSGISGQLSQGVIAPYRASVVRRTRPRALIQHPRQRAPDPTSSRRPDDLRYGRS